MKFALFTPHAYERGDGWTPGWDPSWAGWPGPPRLFDPGRAQRSHGRMLELCQVADETGVDWVTPPGLMPGGRIRPPLCGSPETVARQVAELREAMGAGVLDLILYNDALPHELARESVRLFGTEVIPRTRDL